MTSSQSTSLQDRARLIAIIKERSFEKGGEKKLASGRTSNFYFNMKPTMLHAEGAHLIGRLVLQALRGETVEMVGGLEMGAVPIAAAVAATSHATGWPVSAFFVRKQTKDHGTKTLIEGLAKGESLKGKRVVVLEDVTTTGGSALKAVEALKAEGAVVVRVLTLVDRKEGAAAAFAKAGLTFTSILTTDDFAD
jgi:orotate phosphoribosyltransferase